MTNPCDDFDSNECQEALLSIYEYLDGHLEVERRTIIATHIEVCSYCNDTYSFEGLAPGKPLEAGAWRRPPGRSLPVSTGSRPCADVPCLPQERPSRGRRPRSLPER